MEDKPDYRMPKISLRDPSAHAREAAEMMYAVSCVRHKENPPMSDDDWVLTAVGHALTSIALSLSEISRFGVRERGVE